ncbi:uncharacterized protein [Linepithema humile]|uniref:uncharacterized protein n=1 Tax=Linepithema humile TaxID=83485 RepID=UPI00351F55B3
MASERWKNDIAYAMTPFKLLAWPIGVWPLQVYNVYSLVRCVVATCCMSIIVILPTMEIYMGCTDAEQNIDSLMLICCGVLGVQKTIIFRIYANNLKANYGAALNDYKTIEDAEHRFIMRRHASVGRILSCFMVFFSYFSVIIYSLIPLLGDDQSYQVNITSEDAVLEYPMPSRCALEYFNAPTSIDLFYRIISLFEFIVLILTCTCNHGNDSLFLNITLHVCGQVKILKARFIDFDVTKPQVYDRLNALIQRHNHLIVLAKKLASTISTVLLTQLFISSLLLCIMGFQFILALKFNNPVMMGKSFMVLCTMTTQVTVYSVVGDYLKSQMEEIGLYIYQSTWYALPAKLMKHLVFIIMRTQSPTKLQAGNFVVLIMMILVQLEMYHGCSDMYQKLDSLMMITCGFLGILKITMFRVYADNLIRNFTSAVNDYDTIDSEEKRIIMRRHAFMGRATCYSAVIFSYFSTMGLILAPLLANDKDVKINISTSESALIYPIPSSCTLQFMSSWTIIYIIIFVLQCMALTITCNANLGSDSLFLAITLHVCGQMELLRKEFTNFGVKQKNINEDFSKLMERHCYLLDHVELLIQAINFALLLQLLVSCILICVMGFQFLVALNNNDIVMLIKTGAISVTLLSQLFAYSYVGNYLKYQTEETAYSIYCCNWYYLSVNLMKNILFVIARSQHPIQLAAGKFFVINIETYMFILKTSLSYLSVLRVMLE